ncbi:MAG: transposase [Selenomonadaceae bacterium]|nr:transposase [Selenomonadaceae bacterium]
MFEAPKRIGRPSLNPRTVFSALMWLLKSGARWRDLPARYGNWNSIYHKFRQGVGSVSFNDCYNSSMSTQRTLPCLSLIRLFAKCLRVPVRL